MLQFRLLPFAVVSMVLCPSIATSEPLQFAAEFAADGAASLRGGARSGQSWHGMALLSATWQRTRASDGSDRSYVSILGLTGSGPTAKFVGDLLTVSNSEGYESLRLYASWWESERQNWSLRVGLLLADEEFGYSDAGGELINASFGWPIFVSANTRNTGPAFFAAGLGARLRVEWNELSSFQLGVYDGDTFDSASGDPRVNRDGLHYRLNGEQGIFAMAEFSSRLNESTRVKLGGWAHTGDFSDMYRDDQGGSFVLRSTSPKLHTHNLGGYLVFERAVLGSPAQAGGIDVYARIGAAPSDRNAIAWAFDLGSAWYGPLPSRPDDALAVGFSYARHSDGFRRASLDADPLLPSPDYEYIWEVTYRWQFSDKLSVQPDLQYIRHPGGSAALDDALVFLVRVKATF